MELTDHDLSCIREAAYRMWEEAGRPEGNGDEYWHAAERRYRAMHHREDTPEVIGVVQEAGEESFPASDPPAFAGGKLPDDTPNIQIPERDINMPKITIEGVTSVEVPMGKRLVLALTEDAGIDQLHACGGKARCTTCKVEFIEGEPEKMTVAERDVLAAKGLTGVRLSCQILCEHDMTVRATSRFEGSGRKDAGSPVGTEIEPPAEWLSKDA